jgi:hypothetical protein
MANGAGLDPNSEFMVSYINSSKGKNSWAKIDEEIGNFDKIIRDETRPEDERVDAKGYLAICQFKILGNLSESSEADREKKFEELKAAQVFSKYFLITDEEPTYQQVFDATKKYSEDLVASHQGKETFYDQSALNSAYAVLIKLPFFDSRLSQDEKFAAVGKTCEEYAAAHFESAMKSATLGDEVGNGRGYVFLKTAYDFANNPPYRAAVPNLPKDLEDLKKECAEKSAACGNLQSHGSLGEHRQKDGELDKAEDEFRIAANAGFSQYQYMLGVLLFQKGKPEEGLGFLRQAKTNEFDIDGELAKEIKKSQNPAKKIILEGIEQSLKEEHERDSAATTKTLNTNSQIDPAKIPELEEIRKELSLAISGNNNTSGKKAQETRENLTNKEFSPQNTTGSGRY